MPTLFYYLGISLLFAHEMDAVAHKEWQLLYVLRTMTDQMAYPLFVAMHVPLFFVIIISAVLGGIVSRFLWRR